MIIAWNYWVPTLLYSPIAKAYGSGLPDFHIFYSSGLSWLSHTKPTNFIYPPTSLPFYGFFALFNFDLAGWLWLVTYLIIFLAAMIALALSLDRVRKAYFVSLTGILFFTSYALLLEINLGQVDLLVASLSILSLAMQRLKHDNTSAFFLSCATLLKGPPFLLLIYFVLYRRDLRYILRFVLVSLVTVAASLLVVPWQLYARYFRILLYLPPSGMGMSQSLLNYTSAAYSLVVAIVGVLLFSIFAFRVASRKYSGTGIDSLRDDGMFLLNVLFLLLFSPRIWPATYVWIILPAALFLSNLLREKVRSLYLFAAYLDTFLLNANPSQVFLRFSEAWSFLPVALFGNIMLAVILVLTVLRPSVAYTGEAINRTST